VGNDRTDVEQMDRYFIKEDVLGVSIKDSEVDEAAARICCCLETDSRRDTVGFRDSDEGYGGSYAIGRSTIADP
jgi:hypothetical protein